jgi:hypothetical protein
VLRRRLTCFVHQQNDTDRDSDVNRKIVDALSIGARLD